MARRPGDRARLEIAPQVTSGFGCRQRCRSSASGGAGWGRRGMLLCRRAARLGWYVWPRDAGPAPPEIPWEKAEPAVARILREHYQAVREDPRSGHAWGRLGMVLLANGYGPQAYTCLVQAEKLDPHDPK